MLSCVHFQNLTNKWIICEVTAFFGENAKNSNLKSDVVVSPLAQVLQNCVTSASQCVWQADAAPLWPAARPSTASPESFPLFICSVSSSLTPQQVLTLCRGHAAGSQVKVQPRYALASNATNLGKNIRAFQWPILIFREQVGRWQTHDASIVFFCWCCCCFWHFI